MPKYAMRKKPMATLEQRVQTKPRRGSRKYTKRLPKDPNKLLRWAGAGTLQDYEKLHKMAEELGYPDAKDFIPSDVLSSLDDSA